MKLLIASSFLFASAHVSAFSLAPAANTHGTTSTVSSERREKMKNKEEWNRKSGNQLSSTNVITYCCLFPYCVKLLSFLYFNFILFFLTSNRIK